MVCSTWDSAPVTAAYSAHSASTKMVQCLWIRVNETGFILLKPDSTMGIGLYVWYFYTYPARVPLPPGVPLFASKHLVAESLHGPEPCPRSADSRSTTFIKGLAARELALETAGFLVSRESGARAIRSPRPCLCLVRLVAEIFDICFVVCRYAGSPCPRIARASRIATIKSWEFFPTVRDLSMNFYPTE